MIPAVRRLAALGILVLSPLGAGAQQRDSAERVVPLQAVTITATRSARTTFDTPQPVLVFDSLQLRRKLASPVDLFTEAPGLDVSGLGSNQRRPEIRGLRGQRILLLQDGLRLNNARRQQDFGELPALASDASVARVEVVRGPSSVLYGSDAIGGVVNIISAGVPRLGDGALHGALSWRYAGAGRTSAPDATLAGRVGRLGFRANAAYRDAEPYRAPAGSFGNITFSDEVRVEDSGIRDRSYDLALVYDLAVGHEIFARGARYRADEAGFGYVDPKQLGPNQPLIRIRYPEQDFNRVTLGYRGRGALGVADRFELTGYGQENERRLHTHVAVAFGPPGAGVTSDAHNFTDLRTLGMRAELAKLVGTRHLFTYGFDWFRDRSENTDSSVTVTRGFGPPSTRRSTVPTVPYATFRSTGVFAQLELRPVERLTAILGTRWQDVAARTRPTPGITRPEIESRDQAAVWSANALYRFTPHLNAVVAVGRGFRTPNLVERFFEGTAAEGGGFQRANPDLEPETSINVDVGLRAQNGMWYAEAFAFRNDLDDAVRIVATGDSVNRRPAFQNRNVGRLRIDGVELTGGVQALNGWGASLSYSRIDGRNISNPDNPVGDTYSSKVVGDVGYRPAHGWFNAGYTVRHQGRQKDVIVGANPIGSVIPAFTVHSARGRVRLPDVGRARNHVSLVLDNITNELYSEFPNASFFRPEPARHLRLGIVTEF